MELFDIFVEGLIPITAFEEVAGARCLYRERDHAIVAVPGNEQRRTRSQRKQANSLVWKLGDRVRVRAERIDPMRRRVEFALLSSSAVATKRVGCSPVAAGLPLIDASFVRFARKRELDSRTPSKNDWQCGKCACK